MINYATEKLADIIEALKPLIHDHWSEVENHQDIISLNPNFEKYKTLDEMGILHVVTMRDEKKLVGYFISFIQAHPHHMDCLMALNDVLFIDKEYRKGFNATRLIKFAETELKELGVMKTYITVKLDHDFSLLLEKMNYKARERIYEKLL